MPLILIIYKRFGNVRTRITMLVCKVIKYIKDMLIVSDIEIKTLIHCNITVKRFNLYCQHVPGCC